MKFLTALLFSASILSPAFSATAVVKKDIVASKATPLTAPLKVTSVEGITEYRLGNGLRVLLFPDASNSTVTTNIVYMVGSRYENYGETGMAHLLEHLLFKPTANFGIKKGTKTPVQVLNASGAQFNGQTFFDRTNYFATFPANDENLNEMLALEADRMVNSPIDQNDLWNPKTNKGEMTVVRNEFEMGESDPVSVTKERLQAVAFDWHNYGKSTIGARSDIENVNVARLRAFYKTYYQPDNAILMVAGRFDPARVLKQINQQFGRIPKPTRMIKPTYTVEPTQDGERSVTVRRSGGTQFVGAGYHVAPSGHPDSAALDVLSTILLEVPNGRLHKALVEAKLATSLDSESASNLEPGYCIYGAVVPKDLPLDVTQEILLKVLENFKDNPVTEAEVARAKQTINKNFELALNNTADLTISLTESMAAGDWRLFFLNRDRMQKVDAATVQAVATKYFKPSNRTLGRFIPTDAQDRTEVPNTPDITSMVKDYKGRAAVAQGEIFDSSPANIESRTQRFTLDNGLKGALLPKKTKGGMVNVSLVLRTGTEDSLMGKAIAGDFASSLLMRGTDRLSRQDIKDAFDKLKAEVNIGGSAESVNVSIATARENLAPVLDLLAEILKTPSFNTTEFLEYQRERAAEIEQSMPEPQPLAMNAFARLLDARPAGHVKHVPTLPEQLASIKALKIEEIKTFHAAFYGANNATFAAVGDFDPALLKAQISKLFGGWNAPQPYVRIPSKMNNVAAQNIAIETPDKANSVLVAVQPLPMKDSAPVYPAMLLADYMLGGGALRSRLADRIRQQDGLSYSIGSQLNVSAFDSTGMWMAYAISAPQNTPKVELALREEVARAIKDGFTEAELTEAKKGWRQSEEVVRTSDGGLAGRLSSYLTLDRTMIFDKELETKVMALSVAQVNEALRQNLKPANLSVVLAGDFAKVAKDEIAGKK